MRSGDKYDRHSNERSNDNKGIIMAEIKENDEDIVYKLSPSGSSTDNVDEDEDQEINKRMDQRESDITVIEALRARIEDELKESKEWNSDPGSPSTRNETRQKYIYDEQKRLSSIVL